VLSHANILANCAQISARVDYQAQDKILNALPLFHSFGLTAGTLLPITAGMRVFFYPSPLHYRIVPEMAYDIGATIMFGTNTFLKGYARFAHPYDFYTLRYVFAGAEKLSNETRRIWSDKFGVRVIEGYGATEASPVLASNTPMDNRPASVGRLLPGIDHYLEDVPGVERGQRLVVRGPNIMLGYLRVEQPGVLEPPRTARGPGWYDTGDIVEMDDAGFISILGRAKRFAKVAGEMVSLGEVEELVSQLWPERHHAIVAVADASKGEQLVLVTEQQQADRKAVQQFVREKGASELAVPRRVMHVKNIPVLGSGKIDYPAVTQLVKEQSATV
jgi:acyl-[acyl-carrier-protein]-phospholipid O-acyltransferase/long-chain-fatty-acid--[acyl-carrier-protein] ligase